MSANSTAGVIVRRATPHDIPVLGRLGALLVKEHHDFDAKRFIPATPQTEKGYGSFLGTQLDEPTVTVLVAEDDGAVIGYVYAALEGRDYMSLRGEAGAVHDIVVEPERRGRGVGRLLLAAALSSMKEKGAPRVVLSTAEKNEAAQRLFERAGFRRTMIEMTRELND
jgi:ribosomal protein S18 acetylase RimI-like enzyme